MRLTFWTGTEGSPVSSLNCDRSLHSGIRVPEVVMSVDCQNCTTSGFCMHQGLLCNLAGMGGQALGCSEAVGVVYTQPMPGETKQPRLGTINIQHQCPSYTTHTCL